MAVPGAPRQPLAARHALLHSLQDVIQPVGHVPVHAALAPVAHRRSESFVVLGGRPFQTRDGVLEGGEVQVRYGLLPVGGHVGLGGVGGQDEGPFVYQAVMAYRFGPHGLGQLLHFVQVRAHVVGEVAESQRDHVRVGQPQCGPPGRLGERDSILERGIAEAGVVIEGVEDGMVRSASVLTAVPDVQRCDTQVLEEWSVVRPRPERRDRKVGASGRFAVIAHQNPGPQPLSHRDASLRVLHVGADLVYEAFQCVRPTDAQEAAAVPVSIDVRHGLVLQLVPVVLGPLGRPQKSGLLSIPRCVHDGSLRPPSRSRQLSDHAGFLQEGDHAAQGIPSAEHPSVEVVSTDDPLIGVLRPT